LLILGVPISKSLANGGLENPPVTVVRVKISVKTFGEKVTHFFQFNKEVISVHSLCHTNASLLIASGADVATVAELLGHSQISTTLDIYTHAFDSRKKEASAVLQKSSEI